MPRTAMNEMLAVIDTFLMGKDRIGSCIAALDSKPKDCACLKERARRVYLDFNGDYISWVNGQSLFKTMPGPKRSRTSGVELTKGCTEPPFRNAISGKSIEAGKVHFLSLPVYLVDCYEQIKII